MARAPLFRVTSGQVIQSVYAASELHLDEIRNQLMKSGTNDPQTLRYRGLGSLEQELLPAHRIHGQARVTDAMTANDARMAAEILGGWIGRADH